MSPSMHQVQKELVTPISGEQVPSFFLGFKGVRISILHESSMMGNNEFPRYPRYFRDNPSTIAIPQQRTYQLSSVLGASREFVTLRFGTPFACWGQFSVFSTSGAAGAG